MKESYSPRIYLLILIVSSFYLKLPAQTVASRPPMGWNSYDCFGYSVNEAEVKANADYMSEYLKPYGWQYIIVDYLWSFDKPIGDTRIPFQVRSENGSFEPPLAMDEWGRLIPQPNKFPSAVNGKGFKPLADYIHSKSLKFGIHVMRGIPRQAVWAKSPIKGTAGITADMIADTNSKCIWLNHMFGLDMKKPGAQEYLNSLLALYSLWGVDFIKVDDISFPYSEAEIDGYKKAIDGCGRPIILSLSPGPTPLDKAAHVAKYANMWRITDDFWDTWKQVLTAFDFANKWQGMSSPGHWPDCDMLMIGKISAKGPDAKNRYSRFSKDELYTIMTFWTIFQSPLIIGGDLPGNRKLELSLYTNSEVLAVNQLAENPHQLYSSDGKIAWYSKKPGSADIYVGLFNTSDSAQKITIDFATLGLKNAVSVRDLWAKKTLGIFKMGYQQYINIHGAVLLKLTPTHD